MTGPEDEAVGTIFYLLGKGKIRTHAGTRWNEYTNIDLLTWASLALPR